MATRGRNPYAWVGILLMALLIGMVYSLPSVAGGIDAPIWIPVAFGCFLLICGIAAYLIWRRESEVERMREQQIEQWQGDMLERKIGDGPESPASHSENSLGQSENPPGHL